MEQSKLLSFVAFFAILGGYICVLIAAQQLISQMRLELDAQNEDKSKANMVWTLWAKHRAKFPNSRLRKVHGLVIAGVILSVAAYACMRAGGWFVD